jgi:hypothetical protein
MKARIEGAPVEGTRLAKTLVEDDGHGVGEVERPNGAEGWDPEHAVTTLGEELLGQSDALLAEDQDVPHSKIRVEVAPPGLARKEPRAWFRRTRRRSNRLFGGVEVGVGLQIDEVPVVEPCSANGVFLDGKPQTSDQVQGTTRCGAKASDIAGVRGDFRLDEHDLEGAIPRWGPEAGSGRARWRSWWGPGHDEEAYTPNRPMAECSGLVLAEAGRGATGRKGLVGGAAGRG